jgi:hypothetical protein
MPRSNVLGVEVKKFVVTFTETVERQVLVEAKTASDARSEVENNRGAWSTWVEKPITIDVTISTVAERKPNE